MLERVSNGVMACKVAVEPSQEMLRSIGLLGQ